ncbi:hypothetical protein K432DRAFT_129952 [Lepidopterella palustris CBS 459.81]|uniref:Uncharacterized protein n=1 Tax=Lepidopterella palustris CBS 459.81 TaxID=1314670 RepID=A0A8E2E4I0_9PEZI|nr:hypothetical protein K432DRAFT_129952 [Lepidopterella palustris CBS 459.81]
MVTSRPPSWLICPRQSFITMPLPPTVMLTPTSLPTSSSSSTGLHRQRRQGLPNTSLVVVPIDLSSACATGSVGVVYKDAMGDGSALVAVNLSVFTHINISHWGKVPSVLGALNTADVSGYPKGSEYSTRLIGVTAMIASCLQQTCGGMA